jgi:hypothetical protein
VTHLKGFVEYRVKPGRKDEYLRLVAWLARRYREEGLSDYAVYESVEQQNLFLETFSVLSAEAYRAIRGKLTAEEKAGLRLRQLEQCVEGGEESINRWFFQQCDLRQYEEKGG